MIRAVFKASVSSGALVFAEPARFAAWAALAKDQPIQVVLEREPKRRTNPQNRRWWSAVIPFVQEVLRQKTGGQIFSEDEAHYAMCLAFLPIRDVAIGNKHVILRSESKKLNTEEFTRLMEQTELWISEEFQVDPALIQESAWPSGSR